MDLKSKFQLNQNSMNFEKNLDFFIKLVRSKDGMVILFIDTPLLKYITPIENCYFQEKLFKLNDCLITFNQDQKTAEQQIEIYKNLKLKNENVFIFNPNTFLFKDGVFNPISKISNYKMIDWNHLDRKYSKEVLTNPFLNFLKVNIEQFK